MRLLKSQTREPSVNQIIRIGMDTSKHIFQLHGVDAAEQPVLRKRLGRKQVLAFFAKLPPTVIGVPAFAGTTICCCSRGPLFVVIERSPHAPRRIVPVLQRRPYAAREP